MRLKICTQHIGVSSKVGLTKKGNFFNLASDLIDDLHFDYHLQKLNKPDFKRECTGIHIYDSIVFLEKNKYYKSTHSKIC